MTGHKAGVVSNLKKDQPALFGVHCFTHRLELAFRDVVKSHPSYQELDKFLLDLYLFYHNSNLNEACLAAGSKVLVPTCVGGTRSLPHTLRALNNLWHIYPALVLHTSQVKQKGQSKEKLTCKSFVVFAHFVWHVVVQLAKLSLSLQSRTCSVADRLQATISVLKLDTEQPSPKLQRVFGQNELCGVKLKENVRRLADKREDMAGLTDKLLNRLDGLMLMTQLLLPPPLLI